MGKDLTEVRSSQRQLMPDRVGLEHHEPTSLQAIAIEAKTHKQHRFEEGVCVKVSSCAQASTTEEPDAGKLYVRVWAGGAG
jgi:hypothetical protein